MITPTAANRKRTKIALVGSGNIGGTLAHLILQRNLGDVVMMDVNDGTARGKALDLNHSTAIDGFSTHCTGGSGVENLQDSDVVIVTAGVPRKPGMSRDDLLSINAKVIQAVALDIRKYCPTAFVIVITNPLDVMVWLMQIHSGLPPERVVGMAGILDSGRFASFLAEEIGVSPHDIQTFVLGGHGDAMVPMPRYTTVGGIPLSEWIANKTLSQERLAQIIGEWFSLLCARFCSTRNGRKLFV